VSPTRRIAGGLRAYEFREWFAGRCIRLEQDGAVAGEGSRETGRGSGGFDTAMAQIELRGAWGGRRMGVLQSSVGAAVRSAEMRGTSTLRSRRSSGCRIGGRYGAMPVDVRGANGEGTMAELERSHRRCESARRQPVVLAGCGAGRPLHEDRVWAMHRVNVR
jgi:hypothetical protein